MVTEYKKRLEIMKKNVNPKKKFHYTDEELAKYCLSFVNYGTQDKVLDVGCGENKVWLNNINSKNKDWVELDLGRDFFEYNERVDWCVGNPPYKGLWKFFEKASEISNEGFGFLISIHGINHFTPKRLEELKQKGFYLNKMVVVSCKRWFGRYFFVVFSREDKNILNWKLGGFT